jgi:hypothetical protein
MDNSYEANHDISSEDQNQHPKLRKPAPRTGISDQECEELCAQLILENLILENLLKHAASPLARWDVLNDALQTDIKKHKRIIAELKLVLQI